MKSELRTKAQDGTPNWFSASVHVVRADASWTLLVSGPAARTSPVVVNGVWMPTSCGVICRDVCACAVVPRRMPSRIGARLLISSS